MVPSPQPASPKPDGTFSIDNVNPGEYQFRLSGPTPDAYIQEARFGDVDALSTPIRISASTSDTLKILVSSKSGQLEGTIVDKNSKPVSGSRAVLIPDQLPVRVDLYKTVDADAQGRFVLRGIVPGDYKVFAWEDLPAFAYFDLALTKESEDSGKKVHIAPSSKSSIELKIISANDR